VTAAAAREFALEPADNRRLASLCGPLEANLRLVESRLGVQIRRHGHAFRVHGARAASTESVLRDLFAETQHHDVTPERVHLCLVEHAGELLDDTDEAVVLVPADRGDGAGALEAELAGETQRARRRRGRSSLREGGREAGRGPGAPPRDYGGGRAGGHAGRGESEAVGVYARREQIRARGLHQREYLANIHHHDLSFGIGPAGTGKTYLAVACAVEALMAERVRRIVLVRPAVEAGERLGFLPGDMAQKVDPYLRPMYDALYEMMGYERVTRFMERNAIEVAPLAFMRGRSLNESFIILDEAQNSTIEQMKMFLTRIGFGSHAVITGDLTQTDLPPGRMSGLHHALQILRGIRGVAFTFFDAADVVRHPLVQRIVQAYESHEAAHEP
jgi:phosphate starvation-inducible protein PhoH and related proteins